MAKVYHNSKSNVDIRINNSNFYEHQNAIYNIFYTCIHDFF